VVAGLPYFKTSGKRGRCAHPNTTYPLPGDNLDRLDNYIRRLQEIVCWMLFFPWATVVVQTYFGAYLLFDFVRVLWTYDNRAQAYFPTPHFFPIYRRHEFIVPPHKLCYCDVRLHLLTDVDWIFILSSFWSVKHYFSSSKLVERRFFIPISSLHSRSLSSCPHTPSPTSASPSPMPLPWSSTRTSLAKMQTSLSNIPSVRST
jgi:hypothetical protein